MNDFTDPQELEAHLRALCAAKRFHEAGDLAIRRYGGRIRGHLWGCLRDSGDLEEVYSQFSMDLWRSLELFQWRCTLRLWCYRLANNACRRFLRQKAVWRRHFALTSRGMLGSDVPCASRESTAPYLRSGFAMRAAELFDVLSPYERVLVMQRKGGMKCTDMAIVSLGDVDVSPKMIRSRAATLRKQYERIIKKLRDRAKGLGLPQYGESLDTSGRTVSWEESHGRKR